MLLFPFYYYHIITDNDLFCVFEQTILHLYLLVHCHMYRWASESLPRILWPLGQEGHWLLVSFSTVCIQTCSVVDRLYLQWWSSLIETQAVRRWLCCVRSVLHFKLFGALSHVQGIIWEPPENPLATWMRLLVSSQTAHFQICGIVNRPVVFTHHNFPPLSLNKSFEQLSWSELYYVPTGYNPKPLLLY
jgi:hypothetical protein